MSLNIFVGEKNVNKIYWEVRETTVINEIIKKKIQLASKLFNGNNLGKQFWMYIW
jgi:hypothetical protein